MQELINAAGILFGLTLVFGGILAFAYRTLRVEEDPRIEEAEDLLPGSNCGACGTPGCHAFAEGLVSGAQQPAGCTVASVDAIERIAGLLGVDAGEQDKRVARLHCAGGSSAVRRLAAYHGESTCRAASVVNAGDRACRFGCLGLGDCDVSCTFDAIRMNIEALPVVDVDKCTACNDCVEACPLDLFTLERVAEPLLVQCASPLGGAVARASCAVACDECGRCALDAQGDAIIMRRGLPIIQEPEKVNETCTFRCPTGAIAWVEGQQFLALDIPSETYAHSEELSDERQRHV